MLSCPVIIYGSEILTVLAVNPDKLIEVIGKFATELGASIQGPAILIGEQFGLYKELSANGRFRRATQTHFNRVFEARP